MSLPLPLPVVEDTEAYRRWAAEQEAVRAAVERYDPRALADAKARQAEWTSGEVWR